MRWATLYLRPPIRRGVSASQIRADHAANRTRMNACYGPALFSKGRASRTKIVCPQRGGHGRLGAFCIGPCSGERSRIASEHTGLGLYAAKPSALLGVDISADESLFRQSCRRDSRSTAEFSRVERRFRTAKGKFFRVSTRMRSLDPSTGSTIVILVKGTLKGKFGGLVLRGSIGGHKCSRIELRIESRLFLESL
jgi:hypothetical protein